MTAMYRGECAPIKWWFFEIPEIDMSGQARRLIEVEVEAIDIVATWLRVAPESISVALTVDVPAECVG
jgi:hypothetical protein